MKILIFMLNIPIIFYISNRIFKKFLSPFSIFFQIFNLCYLMLFLSGGISKGSYFTDKLVILSFISYFIGMIVYKIKPQKIKKIKKIEIDLKKLKKNILMLTCISIIGFIKYCYYLNNIVGLATIMRNPQILNTLIAHKELENDIFNYFILLSIPNTMFISYYIIKRKKNIFFMVLIFISQILVNISTKRTAIIEIILLNLFIYFYLKKIDYKSFLRCVIIFIIIVIYFVVIQNKLNKEYELGITFLGNKIMKSYQTILLYYVGNIPATEELLKIKYENSIFGEATFRIFYKILNRLGNFNIKDTYTLSEFVKIPMLYNTAPIQYYVYRDFGMSGSIIFFCILGYRTTMKFYEFLKGNKTLIFEVAILSSFLIQSIRGYQYIYLDFWLRLLVVLIIGKKIKVTQRIIK